VNTMIENGLLDEIISIRRLLQRNGLYDKFFEENDFSVLPKSLRTIGYQELIDLPDEILELRNEVSEKAPKLVERIELIKIHTRQYAKRQKTWFKKSKMGIEFQKKL
ncbi:MAG TPA: hypothetical protein ENN64_00985, partial [bacterium]|nr:hypothetical protein [bacterium]